MLPPWATHHRVSRAFVFNNFRPWLEIGVPLQSIDAYLTAMCFQLMACGWQPYHYRTLAYTLEGVANGAPRELLSKNLVAFANMSSNAAACVVALARFFNPPF